MIILSKKRHEQNPIDHFQRRGRAGHPGCVARELHDGAGCGVRSGGVLAGGVASPLPGIAGGGGGDGRGSGKLGGDFCG